MYNIKLSSVFRFAFRNYCVGRVIRTIAISLHVESLSFKFLLITDQIKPIKLLFHYIQICSTIPKV